MGYDPQRSAFRAITLYGGRGGRQMLKLRYPGVALDEDALNRAFTPEGVEHVRAMGFNWVFLMASWALPPEDEKEDWALLREAVKLYHAAGIQVSGGLEVSSYARRGSFRKRSWAAVDARGKLIPSAPGRFYACWNNEAWLADVQRRITLVVESGADGLFFHAPQVGGVPVPVGGGLLGVTGCRDAHCTAAYAEASGGQAIPGRTTQGIEGSERYLAWRAELPIKRFTEWFELAHSLDPDLVTAVIVPPVDGTSPIQRYGIDYTTLIPGQDLLLVSAVEPNATVTPEASAGVTAINAVLWASARCAVPSDAQVVARVACDTTGKAAGSAADRTVTAMAEALAMGLPTLVPGYEVAPDGSFTLLPLASDADREAIATFHRWTEHHKLWLGGGTPAGSLAVLFPEDALTDNWHRSAPVFWAVCQTLMRRGLPVRVVGADEWMGVGTLIVPPGALPQMESRLAAFAEQGGRVIAMQQVRSGSSGRPLWTGYRPARMSWQHWRGVRRVTDSTVTRTRRLLLSRVLSRFAWKRIRRKEAKRTAWLEALPPAKLQEELLVALGEDVRPRVVAHEPVLFTQWRAPDGGELWHLVNYGEAPQRVTVRASGFVSALVYSPGEDKVGRVFGDSLIVQLDRYKVLRISPEQAE